MTDDPVAPQVADFARYRVDEPVSLADQETDDTDDLTREEAREELDSLVERIADLQARLYAEERRAVLFVLQGIDTAGKDSSVKHVFSGTNPQGVRVYTFKEPSSQEASHDFLWRYHADAPADGMIHVFNRSHYEDVLVVRVHDLVPEAQWKRRYTHIVDFETMLGEEGCIVLKFFLHISKDEQRERLLEREKDPSKAWKLNPGDWKERQFWDDYTRAYEEVFKRCSTEAAPWHIVPADAKWYRNLAIAQATVKALRPFKQTWVDTLTRKGKLGRQALEALEKQDRG